MVPTGDDSFASFSLRNHDIEEQVDAMFDVGQETIALPLEEKLKYELGDQGLAFG